MNALIPPSLRRLANRRAFVLAGAIAIAACSTAGDEGSHGDSTTPASPFPKPGGQLAAATNAADSSLITVYKTPTCGCCAKWVDHMREHGFRVAVTDVAELPPVKATYKVPDDVATCHTGVIGGYVVEGHVPAADVRRMLSERPDIIGIAVPGMPAGSPGMEVGGMVEKYDVIAIGKDGSRRVWSAH